MSTHYTLDSFESGQSIPYLLKQSFLLMQDCATAVYEHRDLSFMQFLVLLKLKEGVAATPGDLCRLMRHDTGALTRLIDQLEARGYLMRARDAKDRRVVQLRLTADGEAQLAELTPLLVEKLNEVLVDFTPDEFVELTRLLQKLRRVMTAVHERLGETT